MDGLFFNPNMLCDYLNVSIALVLLALAKSWLPKLIGWGLITLICLVSVFTFSPGLGGLLLTVGLWFSGSSPRRDPVRTLILSIAIIGAVLVFASALASPDTNNTDQDLQIPYTTVVIEPSVRVLIWENSFQRLSGQLLFGHGVGANVAELRYTVLNGEEQFLTDAHNMWLNVLGQEGLLGLAAFALLIAAIWKRAKQSVSDNDRTLWALFCAFVGAFLYQGLTGSFEDARHLWLLVGFIGSAGRRPENGDAPGRSS
jgi:O-antigen ligase